MAHDCQKSHNCEIKQVSNVNALKKVKLTMPLRGVGGVLISLS